MDISPPPPPVPLAPPPALPPSFSPLPDLSTVDDAQSKKMMFQSTNPFDDVASVPYAKPEPSILHVFGRQLHQQQPPSAPAVGSAVVSPPLHSATSKVDVFSSAAAPTLASLLQTSGMYSPGLTLSETTKVTPPSAGLSTADLFAAMDFSGTSTSSSSKEEMKDDTSHNPLSSYAANQSSSAYHSPSHAHTPYLSSFPPPRHDTSFRSSRPTTLFPASPTTRSSTGSDAAVAGGTTGSAPARKGTDSDDLLAFITSPALPSPKRQPRPSVSSPSSYAAVAAASSSSAYASSRPSSSSSSSVTPSASGRATPYASTRPGTSTSTSGSGSSATPAGPSSGWGAGVEFRHHEDQRAEETELRSKLVKGEVYQVTFFEKSLGLLLERKDEWPDGRSERCERAVVKLVVSGSPSDMYHVTAGSKVVAVNDRGVLSRTYQNVLHMIQAPERPIRILFERCRPVDRSEIAGSALLDKGRSPVPPAELFGWRRCYVVLGGSVASASTLQVFDTYDAYEQAIIALYQNRPVPSKVKVYPLHTGWRCGGIKEKRYKYSSTVRYFTLWRPDGLMKSIRISMADTAKLRQLHDAIRRYTTIA